MDFGTLSRLCVSRVSKCGRGFHHQRCLLRASVNQARERFDTPTSPPGRVARYSNSPGTPSSNSESDATCAGEAMRVPEVVGEEPVYKRYLSVFNRRILYPPTDSSSAREFEFDVVGHPKSAFHFVCVFPVSFVDGKPRVTLLKEYCWGPDAVLYSLPTGGFDLAKHGSYTDAARAELSEEARLCGGELIRLLPEDHPGISESKWCANRFTPFLVINPQEDSSPGQREGEEFIEVRALSPHTPPKKGHPEITTVGWEELQERLYSGYFSQPSFTASILAIKYLTERQMLPQ